MNSHRRLPPGDEMQAQHAQHMRRFRGCSSSSRRRVNNHSGAASCKSLDSVILLMLSVLQLQSIPAVPSYDLQVSLRCPLGVKNTETEFRASQNRGP